MCSDSEKNMSAFAEQNHAPSRAFDLNLMLGLKDAIRIVPYFVLPQFFYSITVTSPVRIPADDPYTQNQYQLRLPAPPADYQTRYIHQ